MIIHFHPKLQKDLNEFNGDKLYPKVKAFISFLKTLDNLTDVYGVEKISGYQYFYKIRFGDYRLGFQYKKKDNFIILERFLHRSKIYKKWPF